MFKQTSFQTNQSFEQTKFSNKPVFQTEHLFKRTRLSVLVWHAVLDALVSTIVYVVVTLHTITQTRDPSPAHALLKNGSCVGCSYSLCICFCVGEQKKEARKRKQNQHVRLKNWCTCRKRALLHRIHLIRTHSLIRFMRCDDIRRNLRTK